jgi:hypothetical protein
MPSFFLLYAGLQIFSISLHTQHYYWAWCVDINDRWPTSIDSETILGFYRVSSSLQVWFVRWEVPFSSGTWVFAPIITIFIKIPPNQVPGFEGDHRRSCEPNFSQKHQVIHSVLQKAGNIYALTQVSSPYIHVHLPA